MSSFTASLGEMPPAETTPACRVIGVGGPPGTGKTTIVNAVLAANRFTVRPAMVTTRPRRPNELSPGQYEYLSPAEYALLLRDDMLLASVTSNGGHRYGITREALEAVPGDRVPLVELHPEHLGQLRAVISVLPVLVVPPSAGELLNRITRRGTENASQLSSRLTSGSKTLSYVDLYDLVVTNDDLSRSIEELAAIAMAEWIRARGPARKLAARRLALDTLRRTTLARTPAT